MLKRQFVKSDGTLDTCITYQVYFPRTKFNSSNANTVRRALVGCKCLTSTALFELDEVSEGPIALHVSQP